MSKIDEFKVFAKANPTFANYIKRWLYDLAKVL